jgi:drug/metabolite transporter (DMT)-like permease
VTRDGTSFAALVLTVGAVVWAIARPWWTFPFDVLGRTSEVGGAPVWLLCVGVVVIGTIAPYLLTFGALRHLAATDVAVVATAEPLLAGLIAWVVLGEVLTPAQLVGGAVVMAGILLAQTAPPAGGLLAPPPG